MYWDEVWLKEDLELYRKYIAAYDGVENAMTRAFKANGCVKVCDAACGFGANSLVLLSNGFDVYGFDISSDSVWITAELLKSYGGTREHFKVASLLSTEYKNSEFDAVAVRAALDHLNSEEFIEAMKEIQRITKKGGLIYATFDPIEDEELEMEHTVLSDGSMLFSEEGRNGLLFHYYSDEDISAAFTNYNVLERGKDSRGSRYIIIRNQ